ncbi:MAG: lipoyl synthase [Chloroflexi bacterium]|nr:lipoyl synthase [Chloroflexota bacterium]
MGTAWRQRRRQVPVERRFPEWLKVKMPGGPSFLELRSLLRGGALHTVCEEAHCPNIGECWERRSATFMILGDLCTWRCHYCAVKTGRPRGLDTEEPERLARTVQRLGLRYCVITSVSRDDLPDGGACIFTACITKVREHLPTCKVEVLIPDFLGKAGALQSVLEARPAVLNHNIETVPRVFRRVRPKGDYFRSLQLLERSKTVAPSIPTKSGMMVGLGEELDETLQTMRDLRSVGCELLTIGQYLRPSPIHFPMAKFYHPQEFAALREEGLKMGFRHVAAGPLVRSSYHAEEQATAVILFQGIPQPVE